MPQEAARRIRRNRPRLKRTRGRTPQRVLRENQNTAPGAAGLAPSTHLTLPQLDGLKGRLASTNEHAAAAKLGLAMVEAELAVAEDWGKSGAGFIQQSLERWIGTLGGREIEGAYGFTLRMSCSPGFESGVVSSERMYLELYQRGWEPANLKIGEPIQRLEEIDHRLPSIFWSRFEGACGCAGLQVWGPSWAMDQEEWGWLADQVEEAKLDPEAYGDITLPSNDIPKSLKRKTVKVQTAQRILRSLDLSPETSWAGRLLWNTLEMYALAQRVDIGWQELTSEEKEAFVDSMPPSPSVLAMIREGDAITHLIDMEGDSYYHADMEPDPVCCWRFEPTPKGVREVYEKLSRMCAFLRLGAEVIDLIHYPQGREEALPLRVVLRAGAA